MEKLLRFIRGQAQVAFRRQFESTKMAENKISIVLFDSSNVLLDSLEIIVRDHGIKLILMVEDIVKDHSLDSIMIEKKYRVSKLSKTFAS